jgi:hypothetical protein
MNNPWRAFWDGVGLGTGCPRTNVSDVGQHLDTFT